MGIDVEFVQDNQSLSRATGTLRGLHFKAPPFAQGKLVRCGHGAIFDVAVDIRRDSPTYGVWEGYELTSENGYQLYVPVDLRMVLSHWNRTVRSFTNALTITHLRLRVQYDGIAAELIGLYQMILY